jgi:hypothetical protein
MTDYYPPTLGAKAFTCPHCSVYAQQNWFSLHYPNGNTSIVRISNCEHCQKSGYWLSRALVSPIDTPVPMPHSDLPEPCQADYEEARNIFSVSPRAAAALLRLVVQKLLVALGQDGKNINADIGMLVKQGLSPKVQQALDYCRVVGNNAVHPLEISIEQEPEIAAALFDMINFIVEDRITRTKEIDALYAKIPEGALKAIEKRDTARSSHLTAKSDESNA